ncbi:MAG: FG-GAP repeat protein [Candidatus Schekmanbacteria bacterium]|nr:FG-GAP repeat protein [Candidatus Schekmanbacteria bacterium]
MPARRYVLSVRLISLLIGVAISGAAMASGARGLEPGRDYVPGQLLVRFRSDLQADQRDAARVRGGARRVRTLRLPGWELLALPDGQPVEVAVKTFRDFREVLHAEPNYLRQLASTTPDDPNMGLLWGLHNYGQEVSGTSGTADADVDAPEAWDISTGSTDVVVAVVDTGVAYDHPDFTGNLWTNPGESGGGKETNGQDDDGNGLVDDWRGWDFVGINSGDPASQDNDPRDVNGHGSHVAGTIGARGDDGYGVAGINWRVSIMPLRVCGVDTTTGSDSCSSAAITDALVYAAEQGANVVNGSFGGPSLTQAEWEAIAAAKDTLFVFSAANDSSDNDTAPVYPCGYDSDNVICVAATDANDALAMFSNWGATSVDLGAPGVNILSAKLAYGAAVLTESFSDPAAFAVNWETDGTNNTWTAQSYLLEDHDYWVDGAQYANDTDSWAALTQPIDLSGQVGCLASFDTNWDLEPDDDFLYVEVSSDDSWSSPKFVRALTGQSPGFPDSQNVSVDLSSIDGQPTAYLAFRMTTDADDPRLGVDIDNLGVRCQSTAYGDAHFVFLGGTSMASPHVAGGAALAWAAHGPLVWSPSVGLEDDGLGFSVAAAGDVNGDGHGDVVIGVPGFDGGETNEGQARVYDGSGNGLSATPSWSAEGGLAAANFGHSVAGAGDVNGDGYGDVIVGAPFYNDGFGVLGRVYVFHGSATGLAASPAWWLEGNQPGAAFGSSVAGAGDVNGDGYGDVIVGAGAYDEDFADEGRVHVYLGSATGLSVVPAWVAYGGQSGAGFGFAVAGAGDVNGDGYSDVVIAARYHDGDDTDEGRAYLFHGAAGGLSLTPGWTADGGQTGADFGYSVAGAGDVNGDGFADVAIGSPGFSGQWSPEMGKGRVYVYHGAAAGLASDPAWFTEGDQMLPLFGGSVSGAGDVNGDGYADLVVGAPQYDNEHEDEGRALVFLGSASGMSDQAAWKTESDQDGAKLGYSVASAGDVNSDGFADLIVGAPAYDGGQTDEGMAWMHLGGSTGVAVPSWIGRLKNAVLATVDPISSLSGITVTGGRLNLRNLLASFSTNAKLGSLKVSAGTIKPAFDDDILGYSVDVGSEISSLSLIARVVDPAATLTVNGTVYASGAPASVDLNVGANAISIVVTAGDGKTVKTYALLVNRAASSAVPSGSRASAVALFLAFGAVLALSAGRRQALDKPVWGLGLSSPTGAVAATSIRRRIQVFPVRRGRLRVMMQ